MTNVINLLERPTYGYLQVDHLLGLRGGTARRWVNGYVRAGKQYPPLVREAPTEAELVTWGEFVETRLLSEFRSAGVPLIRMRPAIEELRAELNTAYPLASAQTWLAVDGQELVAKVQESVGLEKELSLVSVLRTGQQRFTWTKPADDFRRSVTWSGSDADSEPMSIHPFHDDHVVVISPLRGFGEPVVRNVRTEIIAELVRAGEPIEAIAELYELPREQVDAAVRYELRRLSPAAA